MMNALRRVMYGRYGADQLSFLFMALYVAAYLVFLFTGWIAANILSFLFAAIILWRALSRNIARRRAENAWFMRLLGPLVRRVKMHRAIRRDKEHCYFKCPACRQQMRVPKGKGKISVTCRACGASFEEKS